MIGQIILFSTIPLALRYPGILIPGLMFGFTVGATSQLSLTTTLYAVAAIVILMSIVILKRVTLRLTALDATFFALVLYYSLTATWMAVPGPAIAAAQSLSISAISVYLAAKILGAIGQPDRRIVEMMVGFCALAALLAPLSVAAGSIHYGRLWINGGTPVGLSQPQPYCIISALGLLAMKGRRLLGTLVAIAGAIAAIYIAALTGARGSLLATAGGVLVLFLFSKSKLKNFVAAAIVGVSTALLLWAGIVFGLIDPGIFDRILDFETYGGEGDFSSAARRARFDMAQQYFALNPLFGVGVGGFSAHSGFEYPHNLFLEVAAETGAVGLTILATVMLAVIARWRRVDMAAIGWPSTVFLAYLIAALVHQQVSFELSQAKGLFLIGFIAGLPQLMWKSRRASPTHFSVSRQSLPPIMS